MCRECKRGDWAEQECVETLGYLCTQTWIKTHPDGHFIHISCTDLDQCGGDIRVRDPAGDDQRLLLLHVQHIWAQTRMVHKWLLAVWNPNTAVRDTHGTDNRHVK